MKNQLLNINGIATGTTPQSYSGFSEDLFLNFLKQQRYTSRHIRKIRKGFKLLTAVRPIESIIEGLKDHQFLKETGLALTKKYNPDNAKISLTAAHRVRDCLLRYGIIEKTSKLRTRGCFLEIEKEIHRYVYLERNLSEIYADRILKIFKDLTDFLLTRGKFDLREVDQVLLFEFLSTLKASKTKMSNLRVLLRFLYRDGYLKCDYSPLVLSVRSKDSEVRKFLSSDSIECLLKSIDRETASGKQDYLFFILMARLGLRAIEILRLKMSDIDWEQSRLFIHGKHDYHTTLPFSHEIGEALVDYLKHSRRGSDEHIFITMRPPFRKLLRSKKFNSALRDMYDQCGIKSPTQKVHLNVFRHSLATNSLNSGRSMREVKAIMRHENVETTMVYAKYNLPSLLDLAAEWPEVSA